MIAVLPVSVAAFTVPLSLPNLRITPDTQPSAEESREGRTPSEFPSQEMTVWVTSDGETLKSIAKSYYGTESHWTTIWNDNGWLESPENVPGNKVLSMKKTAPERPEQLSPKLITRLNTLSLSAAYKISSTLQMPLDGYRYVSTPFRGGHPGIDLVTDHGTPVLAAADGTVIEIGWSRIGYGKTLVIDHGNGMSTRYAHLSRFSVKHGDFVSQGQSIGAVGCTGRCSGNHLHFEIYKHGRAVSPFSVLRRG